MIVDISTPAKAHAAIKLALASFTEAECIPRFNAASKAAHIAKRYAVRNVFMEAVDRIERRAFRRGLQEKRALAAGLAERRPETAEVAK